MGKGGTPTGGPQQDASTTGSGSPVVERGASSPAGMEYLSFSRLNSYDMCGEKFRLSYIERVPQGELGAGIGGKAVHSVIYTAEQEGWWRGGEDGLKLMVQAFLAVFEEGVERAGGPDGVRWGGRLDKEGNRIEGYLWWKEHAGELFLRRYKAVREFDEKAGWTLLPSGVEMEVGAHLGDTYVKGYIDALPYITPDGEAVIRDWKTGTFNQPFQLAVYSWLLANRAGNPLTVDWGQIGYLRGSSKDSWLKDYDLRPWRDLVPRKFTDLMRGIEAGIFALKPSNLCATCMVRPYCDYGKTLAEDGDALS